MATNDELNEQLSITQKLNRTIEQMAATIKSMESSWETQSHHLEKLNRTLDSVSAQHATDQFNTMRDATEGATKQVDEFGTTSEQSINQVNKAAGGLATTLQEKFPKASAVAVAGISGLWQGLKNVLALGKSMTGFLGSIASGAFEITAAIVSIPLKIFTGLVDLAASADAGMSELRQAIEDIRKEFGDLSGPTSAAVIDVSKNLQNFSDTGLSTWRVFGRLHERLNLVREVATAMGATFELTRKEWEQNGGALLAFQKGLGITNEQMKTIGQRAISSGKTMSSFLLEVTKQTTELGEAFGISQKVIGKDMAKAFDDMKHFATLSVKEIARASVYARKLGVELDKIVGTLDAFETFDTAAENAAKLTQSFGVTVDAFKLMSAQSPDEQIDLLRKSFGQAGVDVEKFNRQQLKLLSSTTGLDEATAKQVFSMKNQGVSLEQIKKKSEGAEKKTLTQAEAMSKLADSIERMVKSGVTQTGGFFDQFVKGFFRGIQTTKEFRQIIYGIKRGLRAVMWQGVELGRAFVKHFPGVKDFLGGLAEFFQPGKYRDLAAGVKDVFIDFFKDLTKGQFSFEELMKQLQEKFFNFFDMQNPAGKKVLQGFKKITTAIGNIVSEAIKFIGKHLTKGIKWITGLIRGDEQLPIGAAAGAAGGALGFLNDIITPIIESLKEVWPELKKAGIELMSLAWSEIVAYLKSDEFFSIIKPAIPYIAGLLFGPALARALVGTLAATLTKSTLGAIGRVFTPGGAVAKAASEGVSKISKAGQGMGGGAAGGAQAIQQVGAINKAAGSAISGSGADKWGARDAVRLGLKLLALAGALAVGGVAIAGSVVAMRAILKSGGIKTPKDAAAPLTVMGAMVASAVPLALSMKLIGKVGSVGNVLKGGLIMTAAVGIVGGVGAGVALLLKQVGSPSQLIAAGKIMASMTGVFLGMIPLVLAATAIGALATGPQAVVLVATAAGMAVITGAVTAVAAESMTIIKQIEALNVTSGFQTKMDAFLGIMSALNQFTSTFVNIVDLLSPSLTEFITGAPATMSQKINSATGLIESMIGDATGRGLIGMVNVVLDAIKELNVESGLVEAAKVFSSILSATTSMLQAMTPPDAWFDAGTNFINQLIGSDQSFARLTTDAARYMEEMRGALMNLMLGKGGAGSGMISIIKELTNINIPDPQKATQIASLLGTVTTLIEALSPDPKMLEALSVGVEHTAAWGLLKTNVKSLDFEGIQKVMGQVASGFGKHILPAVTGLVEGVLSKMGNLSPEQAEGLNAIGPIISATHKLLSETGKLKTDGLGEMVSAVQDIIEKSNELEDILADGGINKIDVPAKLKVLARGVGLGSKGRYTIQNKNVNITVNLSVTMNAADMERALIMRSKSVIRDRINFSTSRPGDTATNEIPDTIDRNLPLIRNAEGAPQ